MEKFMKAQTLSEKPRHANTVSVKLDISDRERINVLASTKKRTAHYLMKEAIHEYIQREESRMNFINAAVASAKEFEETGLHITLDEMDSWMESWGTDNEKPMPICHK
ncbi:MAG: CopG family transcriptional regulator [Burkholderiales bacterium]|nr:CopG family transcriptional regulator [Burkholderiales bacterium]